MYLGIVTVNHTGLLTNYSLSQGQHANGSLAVLEDEYMDDVPVGGQPLVCGRPVCGGHQRGGGGAEGPRGDTRPVDAVGKPTIQLN